jgi:site-specific recombinase XerD
MTPLRQRMIEEMKLRNLAPRTIKIYTDQVAAFARYFGKSHEHLDKAEVRSYLLYLVEEKHVSWGVYNQNIAALRFLYEVTLDRQGNVGPHPLPQAAQEASDRPQPQRDGPLLRGRPQHQAPRHPNDRLRRRPADLGGRSSTR